MRHLRQRVVSLLKITTASERRFFADIFRLTSLSAIAKIITVLTLPLLARIYAPEDFGVLSGYVAMLGFVSCVGAFAIEFTISLPRTMRKARYLLSAALTVSLLMIAAIALFVFFVWPYIAPKYSAPGFLICFLISSIGVLWFCIFRQWLTRCQNYTAIGIGQCKQSVAQVIMRFAIPAIPGLAALPGLIVGDVAGRIVMAYSFWRSSITFPLVRYAMSFRIWLGILKQYRKQCFTYTVSSILNELPLVLLPLTIIYFYQETQAGYVSMAFQAVHAVVSILIVAVSQVFFGNITQLFHQQPSLVHGRFIRLTSQLSLLMLPGIVLVMLLGPWLFATIFGENWASAGLYCQILLPSLVAQSVISPSLSLLILTQRVHKQFMANLFWVCCMLSMITINYLFHIDIKLYLAGFSISCTLAYLWLAIEIHKATKNLA